LNKQRFSQLVRHYGGIQDDDRIKLHELVKNYPYSQIIHTLIAKANADAKTEVSKQTLNYAALYTTDRSVLKEIIESQDRIEDNTVAERSDAPPIQKESINTSQESVKPEEVTVTEKANADDEGESKHRKVSLDPSIFSKDDIDGVRQEIWEDLKKLEISRANYLSIADEKKSAPTAKASTQKPKKASAKRTPATTKSAKVVKTKKSTTSKSSTTTAKKTTSKTTRSTTAKASATKSKVSTTPKSKTTSSKTSDVKKKPTISEQQKIINKFIDKEPRITAKTKKDDKATWTEQKDLAEPSTEFGEDLISENLAKILAGQGKNDKAIDIYKKLIWRFPQKKSYFAALIEDLKK